MALTRGNMTESFQLSDADMEMIHTLAGNYLVYRDNLKKGAY